MAIKLKYDASTFADALRPAFGEVIQEETKANISLSPDGTNPAEDVDDFLVPVIFGSDQKLVNARWSPQMFPNGVGAYDKCPVLCKLRGPQLYITQFDPTLYNDWADSLAAGNVAPPVPLTQTDWIEDGAITTPKIENDAVTRPKLYIRAADDAAVSTMATRFAIDETDTGDLVTILDAVFDGTFPTVSDDNTLGYRIGSRIRVQGTLYPLVFEMFADTTGAALWHCMNPRQSMAEVTAPGSSADRESGYIAGLSHWKNTLTGKVYICSDDTPGSAVWDVLN